VSLRFSSSYASTYDLLNEGKPYQDEVDFVLKLYKSHNPVEELPKSVLDLGCGSGIHLNLFPSDTKKTGVDISESMLDMAKKRGTPNATYLRTKIGDFQTESKFDLVYSLFHVMSYQTTEMDLDRSLAMIRNSLSDNGLAVFDFWHRVAWDQAPPVTRMTVKKNSLVEVKRVSRPTVDRVSGLVTIEMEIFVHQTKMDDHTYEHFSEHHEMRAYTLQELVYAARLQGLEIVCSGPWMTNQRPLSASDWYGWLALKKAHGPQSK